VENQVIRLRKRLTEQGLDAGAETIHAHLLRRSARSAPSSSPAPGDRDRVPSVATIWRILVRGGFVIPQPQKRPRSSWIRFEATLPNERWQADITHWQLVDHTTVEVLNIEDDHSRLDVASTACTTFTESAVVTAFKQAFRRHGVPARVLTDNAAVFTGQPRRGGRVSLEIELGSRRISFDHSRPYHPQTCGKVERFHQTQKKWLAKQPPATTIADLQHQLDRFRRYYNTRRPHRSLGRNTHRPRPTRPAQRPDPPEQRSTRTGGSATTSSTPAAPSRCDTRAGYTTSASAAAGQAPTSAFWSATDTSASSPATANSSAT
jgi:transposase InsO family protein